MTRFISIIFSFYIFFFNTNTYAKLPAKLGIKTTPLLVKKVGNKKSTYTVLGHTHTLLTKAESRQFSQVGPASYYGSFLHGHKTANGEILNENALTAAHPKLAMNSYALVTNLANNKQVIVRINDRGPFRKTRAIDLSKGAACAIGMLSVGIQKVKIEGIIVEDDGYLSGKGAETLYKLAKKKGIAVKTRRKHGVFSIK